MKKYKLLKATCKNEILIAKMEYLERKFNAPMDIVIKAINFCKKNNLCITEIKLNK